MDKQSTVAEVAQTQSSEYEKIKKREKFIVNCAYAALIFGIAYLAFRYAVFTVMPFLIAFIVASILKKAVDFFTVKLRFKRGIASIILVVLFYGIVGVGLFFIAFRAVIGARDFILSVPDMYKNTIEPALFEMFDNINNLLRDLTPNFNTVLDEFTANLTSSIYSAVSNLSVTVVSAITKYATSIPGMLIDGLIMVIATFFMTVDYDLIGRFCLKQLKPDTAGMVLKVKDSLVSILGEYIKSYAIIMAITFAELFAGLSIIGIKSAALLAVIIAVFDILPVVGSGMVMFPWAVITLIQGNITRGLGLLALWFVIIVIRNIMEPRIIGHHVGLHPIITLMAMILGVAMFGGLGLFGLPISLAIIKRMNDQGTIRLYRPLSPEEKQQAEPPERADKGEKKPKDKKE